MKFSKTTNKILSFCFFLIAFVVCFVAYDTGLLHELTNGNPELILGAAPLTIKFTKDIQEGLYPDNEYYNYAINDDALIDGVVSSRNEFFRTGWVVEGTPIKTGKLKASNN